jgi:hypothetical protein
MDNQIGRKPFGYIYVSFIPPTEDFPSERFYTGQKIFAKKIIILLIPIIMGLEE